MAGLLSTFLQLPKEEIRAEKFKQFLSCYDDTWIKSKKGDEGELLKAVSLEHVQIIVQIISRQLLDAPACQRGSIRADLSRDPQFQYNSKDGLNAAIDLALRLWLTLNFRNEQIATATPSIQWDDQMSLQDVVVGQFPTPRLDKELGERMFDFVLPDNFTVVKLVRYGGIKIDWTTSLNEHLDWDRKNRTLKIFPLKSYMQGLRKSDVEIIPNNVIDEYTKTINFLFPTWDEKTQKYLKRKHQSFRLEAPVDYPGPLYLSDFHFWRDRLSTLYTEFCSPPPSMTQLFNDRRNVLQWYTFWFAVLIVALTVIFGIISSVTACLQTRYAYRALLLALEAADSARACPSVTCGSGEAFLNAR